MKIKQDGQYLSFILDKQSEFYTTGYRILKKQEDKGLLSCEKLLFNGHIKLLYPINKLVSLDYDVFSWDIEQTKANVLTIISILNNLADNGFLQPETIYPELEYMYIDKQSGQIFLIALPVNMTIEHKEQREWFASIKKSLMSLIGLSKGRNDEALMELKNDVIRTASSLEELCKNVSRPEKAAKRLSLVLMGAARAFQLNIDKDEFVIGKLKDSVDGLIDFTPTISRRHCQVIRQNGSFFIKDLDSANHTYINGVMIPSGKPVPINAKDRVRLAELEFLVKFI